MVYQRARQHLVQGFGGTPCLSPRQWVSTVLATMHRMVKVVRELYGAENEEENSTCGSWRHGVFWTWNLSEE